MPDFFLWQPKIIQGSSDALNKHNDKLYQGKTVSVMIFLFPKYRPFLDFYLIIRKYSQTDFTPRQEQELVLGQYLEAKLGSDFTELKVRRPKLSKSEQNLSKVENPCSYSSLKKTKNSVSSEENLRFSKWESEVCYVRPNLRASSSSELKISSQNPEIVMVDYGQEEII